VTGGSGNPAQLPAGEVVHPELPEHLTIIEADELGLSALRSGTILPPGGLLVLPR
jgi:hypothetical protein